MTEAPELEMAAERLHLAFELMELGEEIMRESLARQFPEASAPEIERRLLAWIEARPGAAFGDCPGTSRSWRPTP